MSVKLFHAYRIYVQRGGEGEPKNRHSRRGNGDIIATRFIFSRLGKGRECSPGETRAGNNRNLVQRLQSDGVEAAELSLRRGLITEVSNRTIT